MIGDRHDDSMCVAKAGIGVQRWYRLPKRSAPYPHLSAFSQVFTRKPSCQCTRGLHSSSFCVSDSHIGQSMLPRLYVLKTLCVRTRFARDVRNVRHVELAVLQ